MRMLIFYIRSDVSFPACILTVLVSSPPLSNSFFGDACPPHDQFYRLFFYHSTNSLRPAPLLPLVLWKTFEHIFFVLFPFFLFWELSPPLFLVLFLSWIWDTCLVRPIYIEGLFSEVFFFFATFFFLYGLLFSLALFFRMHFLACCWQGIFLLSPSFYRLFVLFFSFIWVVCMFGLCPFLMLIFYCRIVLVVDHCLYMDPPPKSFCWLECRCSWSPGTSRIFSCAWSVFFL